MRGDVYDFLSVPKENISLTLNRLKTNDGFYVNISWIPPTGKFYLLASSSSSSSSSSSTSSSSPSSSSSSSSFYILAMLIVVFFFYILAIKVTYVVSFQGLESLNLSGYNLVYSKGYGLDNDDCCSLNLTKVGHFKPLDVRAMPASYQFPSGIACS